MSDRLTGSCHCGLVRLTFPLPREALNECQCSICRRYGALWAYFDPHEISITLADPATPQHTYVWSDRKIAFTRCARCGCLTHWAPLEGALDDGFGINCRVLDRVDLDRLPRVLDPGP